MDSSRKRVLKWGLIALYAVVPLVVLYRTNQPSEIKDLLFVGVVSLLALGWLQLAMQDEQGVRLCPSKLNLVLALNVVVWLVTLGMSPFPDDGLVPISVRFSGVGLLLLAPVYLLHRRDLGLVLGVLLAAVGVMSAYALLQFMRLDPFLKTEGLVGHFRVSSTTDHPNVLVSVLAASMPLNIVAFRWFTGARARLLLGLGLLLSLGAAVGTMSRGGWAAVVVSCVATLLGLWIVGVKKQEKRQAAARVPPKIAVPLFLLVLVAGGLGLSRVSLDPGERERILSLGGPTVEKRLHIYRASLNMTADSPIVGKGLGTFSLFLPGYRSPSLARFFPRNEYRVEHAVSEPLEVLAESGALGLLAWLLLAGALVLRPLRAARRAKDPSIQALLVGAAAGTLGLVVHGLVEVNLRYQPPLFLFFALPALALAAEQHAGGGAGDGDRGARAAARVAGGLGRLAISVGVGTVFGLVFAVTLSNFVASWHVATGRSALAQGRPSEAESAFRAAISAWEGNLPGRYRRAYVLWQLGHLAAAEAEYREVIRRSPYYFDVNHNLARVLYAQNKVSEAARWVDVAVRINPHHVPSHELAARIAILSGRLGEAEKLARHTVRVSGHDDRAHLTLARVRIAQGRDTAAQELLEEILRRRKRGDAIEKETQRLLTELKQNR
jgi:O-antigen ligase/Tfp pilus assembly protein PilF